MYCRNTTDDPTPPPGYFEDDRTYWPASSDHVRARGWVRIVLDSAHSDGGGSVPHRFSATLSEPIADVRSVRVLDVFALVADPTLVELAYVHITQLRTRSMGTTGARGMSQVDVESGLPSTNGPNLGAYGLLAVVPVHADMSNKYRCTSAELESSTRLHRLDVHALRADGSPLSALTRLVIVLDVDCGRRS